METLEKAAPAEVDASFGEVEELGASSNYGRMIWRYKLGSPSGSDIRPLKSACRVTPRAILSFVSYC